MSALAAVGVCPSLPYRGRDRRNMRRLKAKADTGSATNKALQSGNHSLGKSNGKGDLQNLQAMNIENFFSATLMLMDRTVCLFIQEQLIKNYFITGYL